MCRTFHSVLYVKLLTIQDYCRQECCRGCRPNQSENKSFALTSFGKTPRKTSHKLSSRQRIKWNNNNDVPGALWSEAAQWTDWLESFTAAYLGSSLIAYFSYYPFINNIIFRFFKRTETMVLLRFDLNVSNRSVLRVECSFWFLPSNSRPVVVFPVSDGWKVFCWFSTEQEMCFHSYTISETDDLFRSVFEMCILKMPKWNKAEKPFQTVRQLLRTDFRSSRIYSSQGSFTVIVMVTVSRKCVSIVREKACRLVLASRLPVTASRVTPTNSTCFTF